MGIFGTSKANLSTQMNSMSQQNFKSVNNLLTLQENHVEEFFQYHGEQFLQAFEQLLEDVTTRVVSQMLVKMKFVSNTNGDLEIHPDSLSEFTTITQENIDLDIVNLLGTAVNSEVIMQRRMAKQQYLESQGFTSPTQTGGGGGMQPANPQGLDPSQIQGGNMAVGMNNAMMQQQMNDPYWIDPATGQPTYTPPQSGLGLAQGIGKAVAWAKWLA